MKHLATRFCETIRLPVRLTLQKNYSEKNQGPPACAREPITTILSRFLVVSYDSLDSDELDHTFDFDNAFFPVRAVELGVGNARAAVSMQDFAVSCVNRYVRDAIRRAVH